MASVVSGTRQFISQKEEEIAQIRELALQELEQQILVKDRQIQDVSAQFEELKRDFQFNLQLLDERDAELEKYDIEHAAVNAALAEREQRLNELEESYEQLSAASRKQEVVQNEESSALRAQLMDSEAQLRDLRFQSNEAHLRQQEQFEAQKRTLQRALSEAEEEIERQRRDMAAGFTIQVQQLESQYKQQAEEAKQQAELSRQRAEQCEQEAQAARSREVAQSKAAEEAQGKAVARERELRAVQWELDSMRKLKDDRIQELQEALKSLQQQHQAALAASSECTDDLQDRLAAALREVAEVREAAQQTAQRHQEQHVEEVGVLRQRLEQALAQHKQIEAQAVELQGALKVERRLSQERLEGVIKEAKQKQEAAEAALAEVERRREAELRQAKESSWMKEEEGRALREKVEALKRQLEERRRDLDAYKGQLATTGDRERELQRQLVAAEMKLEAQEEAQEETLTSRHEALLRRLTEQRDTSNAALQECLARCAAKEEELSHLRARFKGSSSSLLASHPTTNPWLPQPSQTQPHPHFNHRYKAIHPSSSAGGPQGAVQAVPAAPAPQAVQSGDPESPRGMAGWSANDILHQAMTSHRGGTGEASGRTSQRPPPLNLSQSIQDLKEALGELSNLPSPLLPDMPPTPGSTASFWLGPSTSQEKGTAAQPTGSPRRSAAFDRSVESLRRLQGASSSPGSARHQQPPHPHSHSAELLAPHLAALEDSRQQNQRLLATITMMRAEVEELQQRHQELQQQALDAPPPPEDVQALHAELAASDQDLHHTQEHLAVVQQQLAAGGHGQGDRGTESGELLYLRKRVQELLAENRSMRREVLALRLAAAGSSPPLPAALAATPTQLPPPSPPVAPAPAPSTPTSAPPILPSAATSSATTTPGQNALVTTQQPQAAAASEPTNGAQGSSAAGEDDVVVDVAVEAMEELTVELEAARDQIRSLERDNEQLMEMSSVLRAERDRLAVQISAQGQDGPSPSSPQPTSPWGLSPFLLPFFNPYISALTRPVGTPPRSPSPPAVQPPAATAPGPAVKDILQAVAANRRAANGNRPATNSNPNLPSSQTCPSSSTTPPTVPTITANSGTTHSTAVPLGLPHNPSQNPDHNPDRYPEQNSGLETGGRGGGGEGQNAGRRQGERDAVYVVRCDRCVEGEGSPRSQGSSRSPSPQRRPSLTRKGSEASLTRGPTPINPTPSGPLGLGTSLSNPPRKPTAPTKISQRETPSQRASLRALQQRREGARPRIRNYNIKDDGG